MKKLKKICRMLLVAGVLCLGINFPYHVSASTIYDSSSDDTIGTANSINMGDTVNGSITETDDLDYYKFNLGNAGCITLSMTSYMEYYCIKLFDSDGEEIWYTDRNEWTETVGYRRDTYKVYLEKGTYYMQVNGYHYYDETYDKGVGEYLCDTSFMSSETNTIESNNSYDTANDIVLGNTITGQISVNDDYDTFKYTLPKAGCVTLDMKSYMKYYCIKIFDSDGEEIWYTDKNEWTETVGYRRDTYKVYLEKGTYYMQIDGYRYYDETYDKSTGKYVVGTKFVSSDASFDDEDDSFSTAKSVLWNKKYTGQISINDDFDTYKFVVSKDGYTVLNMKSYMKYYCIKIFDSDGEKIWYTDRNEWNSSVGYRKDTINIMLSSGTYYMQIDGYRYYDETYDKSTGKYVFSINKLTKSNCEHNWTHKTVLPTYLKKGYDLHKCVKCKKNYKDNYTKKKELDKGYIYSYSNTGKGKIYLQWQTVTDASGYQIRYCQKKDMKKGVKTKTIKGKSGKSTIKNLSKRKNYYVQIRAYKKEGKNIVYGKWSSTKCFRTK